MIIACGKHVNDHVYRGEPDSLDGMAGFLHSGLRRLPNGVELPQQIPESCQLAVTVISARRYMGTLTLTTALRPGSL